MNNVYILGVGPGSADYVLPVVSNIVRECKVIAGGQRNLSIFDMTGKTVMTIKNNLDEIVEFINTHLDQQSVAVLVSGDTGFYSMLSFLQKHYSSDDLEVIPGISSIQYMAAKLKKSWHDAYITSMHGRIDENFVQAAVGQKLILALTDTKNSPNMIAKFLIENGITGKKAAIGENLSYSDERIIEGTLEEIAQMDNFKMSVMVIYNE